MAFELYLLFNMLQIFYRHMTIIRFLLSILSFSPILFAYSTNFA